MPNEPVRIGEFWYADLEEEYGGINIKINRKLYGIYLAWYFNGRPAIFLATNRDGLRLANLSINVESVELDAGEFVINHDVDDGLLKAVLIPPSDLAALTFTMEDTGRRVDFGYVRDAKVWRLIDYAERLLSRWLPAADEP
jgi:hypothetical protein